MKDSRGLAASFALVISLAAACGQGTPPPVQRTSTTPPADENVGLVTDELLQAGHVGRPSTWPTYGGDWAQTRYSPLDEIRRENVGRLRPAWIAQTGVIGSFETTPIVLGREMYVTTPSEPGFQKVIRLDAVTGEVVWQVRLDSKAQRNQAAAAQDLHLPTNFGPHRGVAVYGDRVYLGTLNGTLLALRRDTGAQVFEVQTLARTITSPPLVARGRIVTTLPWLERGAVQTFDAESGKLLWTWYTIPSPAEGGWWGEWVERLPGREHISLGRDIAKEKANQARLADTWKTGGGPANRTPSFDPSRGLVYVTVGPPDPHGFPPPFEPYPGDMRWTNSTCALRIESGQVAWCYQFVPHDIWGAGGGSPSILLEVTRDGKTQAAVARLTGLGNLYVLDRDRGNLLKVSDSYMPLEETPGGKAGAELIQGELIFTGWTPTAYSFQTGLVYLTGQVDPDYFRPRDQKGAGGEYGTVAAVNPTTGKVVWQQRTEKPNVGGVLVTAGGLLFNGRSSGWFDAYDDKTGERVWSFRTGAGCNSAPVTYRVEGRQYVAVACGGHGIRDPEGGDTVLAFALAGQ